MTWARMNPRGVGKTLEWLNAIGLVGCLGARGRIARMNNGQDSCVGVRFDAEGIWYIREGGFGKLIVSSLPHFASHAQTPAPLEYPHSYSYST